MFISVIYNLTLDTQLEQEGAWLFAFELWGGLEEVLKIHKVVSMFICAEVVVGVMNGS